MSVEKYLLVVSASRKVRIAKRPRLYADEVAIPVTLEFPRNWGRVLTDQSITVKVPDFAPEVIHEIEEPGQ
jgi:hypothetical protein